MRRARAVRAPPGGRRSRGGRTVIRGISFEQAVAVADEVCAATGSGVRDYPALAALAAVTAPRLAGVPVHSGPPAEALAAQARAIRACVSGLRPLGEAGRANEVLAEVVVDVCAALNDPRG